jgi:tetratricopeptide (TPR) repeat protein/predicted aspartyl protease
MLLAPDLPVTMRGLQPLVHAQINGEDAVFIADSGAFFSLLTPAAAQQFHLPHQFVAGLWVSGLGGSEVAQVVKVSKFTLFGKTFDNAQFVVAGSQFGSDAVGLLGQNVLRIADVEYDLANGVLRLARPQGDCKHTDLAYWADAAQTPYSMIELEPATARQPHTRSVAYLNGVKIRVMFDTGAGQSLLTLHAAKEAGITPTSPGVTDGGFFWGIGHKTVRTWIARFSSFKVGGEEIKHAPLRFGDVDLSDADMLIGADYFLSHRVYVANSQNRLYFTYNGGPVFDLTARPAAPDTSGSAAAAGEAAHEPLAADAAMRLDQPTDAAGFARRGAAYDARHDYDAALADLSRACELAPTESSYFHLRGVTYLHKQQPDAALADFDKSVQLKPDNAEALIARASLRASRHAPAAEVTGDLDAADRALAKEAEMRLQLARVYESVDQPALAVTQYSKWVDSHPSDAIFMPGVLNARCWVRALWGQELQQALSDCNAALRMKPKTAAFLDSRGLVYLRQGSYDNAIADYDAALQLQPKAAWSLYGRGLAKLRKGQSAEGQADVASASALAPRIAAEAAQHGIQP